MINPFLLTGKVILITGASSGIGRQIAITCAAMGAEVFISARSKEGLQKTIELLPENSTSSLFVADLTVEDQIIALVESLPKKIDGVVHCVGIVRSFPIRFLTFEKIDETMNVNFIPAVRLTAQLMRSKKFNTGSSSVFISSITGQRPHVGGSMYGSSKAALETFCKVMALEGKSIKLRANCISPAMVRTPMFEEAETFMSKEIMDDHIGKYPLGVGYPEDVANAAVFLLSDGARWISGVNLVLDGGYLLEIG